MNYESKKAAVFFVDVLGMSALTGGAIDLSEIDIAIYEKDINLCNGISTPNQLVAAWTLKQFREELRSIHFKYDVRISQLSDCAFMWSENICDLILSASELMWRLISSGVLCRGGLSFGEVIVPTNDKESFGSFVLGDAVTRAAKLEGCGKGCRVFTDADAISRFYEDFPGKVDSPDTSSIVYREIFAPITNPLDFSIVDEFKWYLYYDLDNVVKNKFDIDRNKVAMYMAGLVSLLRHSPYFAWNSSNKHGKIHLSASIEMISSNISVHTGHNGAKISAEYLIEGLNKLSRSNEIVKRHFLAYNVDALAVGYHDKIKERLENEVVKSLELG